MANYTITEDKSFEEINIEKLNSLEERVYILEQYLTCKEGDTRTIDGIECLCVYENPLLFVDKNHDLCYYFYGDDFVNSTTDNEKWAYNYGNVSDFPTITPYTIGEGLNNTNIFINYNPTTLKEGYDTIWDKIVQFRESHSDKWYLPSGFEFENLLGTYIYNGLLQNFNTLSNYWTSTRAGVEQAIICYYSSGSIHSQGSDLTNFSHSSDRTRTRLFCRPWD